MSTIRNFFSPTKSHPPRMSPSPVKTKDSSNGAGKADKNLVVSNMKSVINSVKSQKKHRKRKRQVDETPEIHDISNTLRSNLSFVSPNRTEAEQKDEESEKETSEVRSADSTSTESSKENDSTTSSSQSVPTKSQSASNAFEFMMTARYKSIGSNSPGKELLNKDAKSPGAEREVSVKRKLMLEEWADRKGRAKKRQNEAADDEYIDMVMAKRAKRLKTMLKHGKKSKSVENVDEKISPTKPKNGLKLRIKKGRNRIEDSDDDNLHESRRSSTKSSNRKKNETDGEFYIELSSPIKKRDSLLGYFSKLSKTPTEDTTSKTNDSPSSGTKTRGRPKRIAIAEETMEKPSKIGGKPKRQVSPVDKVREEVTSSNDIVVAISCSSSESSEQPYEGRPKRLCRDKKISYLIDEDYLPVKHRTRKEDKDYAAKPSKPTKLAPIFAKAKPKQLIDPVALRARHEFLMSGIPEKMKIEIEKQRQFEEFYETEFEVFPKISHVGHHTDIGSVDVDLSCMKIRFRSDDINNIHTLVQSNILKIRKTRVKDITILDKSLETMDQKELMRQFKQNDTNEFPYYRCFKQLKRKNAPEPMEKEEDCDNSVELVMNAVSSANGNELFTEKYRPLTSTEVFINTKPLIELQKFLSSWKENMDGREYSSDDFESSSNSGMASTNKAIVLTGPAGCGKTMFVYALANEMNFKVLEINAGARRTGKKVLKKLQEATQSHHVNSNQCSQNDRTKNVKMKFSQSEDSEDSSATPKLSLILIEDAEVVFEEDLGFVESINQLVTTTKRPVILITNQINCPHLCRFINRNMISFKFPKVQLASKWLTTLSIAEHCYVTEDICRALYQQNNCDFRKTLLELQFFIQSTKGKCDQNSKSVVCTNTRLSDLYFKDQNREDVVVPFPVDFLNLSAKMRRINRSGNEDKISDEENTLTKSDSLNATIDLLDIISTAQWFEQKTDSSDRVINHLSDDISHFMVEQSMKVRGLNLSQLEGSTIQADLTLRPHQLASNISSRNYHSTRGLDLDMEPCLRSICRSEFNRSHKERRSSRFYHYLRLANSDSFDTKVLDDQCLIFTE
ncbi:Telomere length regulation protein elg1 [Pseudolycoriella hygida]|uniref:Telomere length regulation protein elg1 n=1 Tax=Pseudolycoriella hygida TaxID=35572 RepID=A0A9Q0MIF7_9DIPT|nr:Telomere length regulation protein elg1 [Pseudolycoriella hygida]